MNNASKTAPPVQTRPLLALDRDEIRLSSPRGDIAAGSFTVTNRGEAALEGTISPALGRDWLRVEPSALRLGPAESLRIGVWADPTNLSVGYSRGEIGIVTNGGEATVAVRLGLRAARSWRHLAAAIMVSAAIAGVAAYALRGVELPASASPAATTVTVASHGAAHTRSRLSTRPSFDRPAALAAIRRAIQDSNTVWRTALTMPSAATLATVKTGGDLAANTAQVSQLRAAGERWQITARSFKILSSSLYVGADGATGGGDAVKIERRALYGPGHGAPLEVVDAAYTVRYSLVRSGGRWLVRDAQVIGDTPLTPPGAALTIPQVAALVLPSVMHIEADNSAGYAVGTGIVIATSSAYSYVITNDHVVSGAKTIKLQRWVNGAYSPATPWIASRVWEDRYDDLAVVRIDHGDLPAARWGDSSTLQPGQEVVAIGYAENLAGGPTVTNGIVSSVLRTMPNNPNGPTYIGHSATINHGNSGGPLIDMYGRVVGINTWMLGNTQGLFFAIPSTRAARVAANAIGTNG